MTTAPATSETKTTPAETSRGALLLRQALSSTPVYMFGVLVVLLLVFSFSQSSFATIANARNIFAATAELLVMATAVTYVMVAGGIDLSVGSVLVFSNVVAAKAMSGMGTNNFLTVIVGFIVAMGAGLLWGIFNGFCITRLKVPALITTLGTLGAVLGAADLITNGTDLRDIPSAAIALELNGPLGLAWIIWISFLVTLIGGLVLAFTRFGRHTYIIGSNEEAGRRGGLNVDLHIMKLYAFSGALAGLAGMLSLIRFSTTTVGGHANDFLVVITGVVLGGISLFGGIGSIIGAVIGIFISEILINGFIVMNIQPFWQQVAIGFILIAAVYLDQLRRRNRERA